ncbi:MAG: glycosyltransferase family 1 protein [Chloroflexi bacterium]|nr:MAG: glycosyltransferase family 1 protein [Chloroflexota bacterium]MBL1196572.1 glycosyltransferase family 1 protein [Chloroflexota bacterium]NOH13867.1 glycosyltransferase family 4 protein [Chloroflexota bacterium]
MNILIILYYYRPHYSGLTIYAERLARALAARGNKVTVLTSQFDKSLARHEIVDGVEIVREPVAFHISKGPIIPSFLPTAWKLMREADVVNLHLPQLDAAPISMLARLQRKPVVLTYQCDLVLPEGFVNRLANLASDTANFVSASAAHMIVNTSWDYAKRSRFLSKYFDKVRVVDAPVVLPQVTDKEVRAFKLKYDVQADEQIIGMVARLAAEKGVEHLARALPQVLETYPKARVLYVGPYENVFGEEQYAEMLAPIIANLGEHWQFLGIISDEELAAFFHSCNLVVLPSTNSTEALGLVQVEAMTCGTPSVASDLPGLRQPVLTTGMGEIFAMGNASALAQAIIKVLGSPDEYKGDVPAIKARFAPDAAAASYEDLFRELTD